MQVSSMWKLALLFVLGCGHGGPSADDRRKAAAREENEWRHGGVAATVTTRGETDDVLVLKNLGKLCSQDMMNSIAGDEHIGSAAGSAAESPVQQFIREGFHRLECEDGAIVYGVDLPYVKKLISAEEERATRIASRRNAMKKMEASIRKFGGTDTYDVRGENGEILVLVSTECSKEYLETLPMLGDLADKNYTRIECTGPKGRASLDMPGPSTK